MPESPRSTTSSSSNRKRSSSAPNVQQIADDYEKDTAPRPASGTAGTNGSGANGSNGVPSPKTPVRAYTIAAGGGGGGYASPKSPRAAAFQNAPLAPSLEVGYDSDVEYPASAPTAAAAAAGSPVPGVGGTPAATGMQGAGGVQGGGAASVLTKSKSQRQFDLCTTLYKRRGGFGRNAENNWVRRCFTLHGPILCYYDTPTLLESDPSRPRGRLNLAKEDTRAEMSTKYGTSSPTEFLVIVNLYVLGSKRKWELCCLNQSDQRRWYDALKAWDGPPDVSYEDHDGGGGGSGGGGGGMTPSGLAKDIDFLGIGRRRTSGDPNAANARRRRTMARESSKDYYQSTAAAATPNGRRPTSPSAAAIATTAATAGGGVGVGEEDARSIDQVPSYDSISSAYQHQQMGEGTPLISNRRGARSRGSKPMPRLAIIDQHVIVSFVAINVAIFFSKYGKDELTLYLSVFMANLVLYYLLDHLSKREEVRRLQFGGGSGSGAGYDGRGRSTSSKAADRHRARAVGHAIPSTVREDREESYGGAAAPVADIQQPPKRLAAGSTIPRATVKPDSAAAAVLQKTENAPTAETVAAYASTTAEDYNESPFTYWNVDASTFNLRIGPNYKKEKKKAPSAPALYDLFAMDIVQDDCIIKSVAEGFEIPSIKGVTDIDTGCEDVPPLFVITVNIPTEEPAMWGGESDGPSCIVILYFTIAKHTLEELKDLDTASPAVKLFVEYCRKAGTDEVFRSRLKTLAVVEDMEKLGLPSFITSYNGKPALITKSGKFTRHSNYIEMTVNVHKWGYLAKKGLYMLRDEFPRFNVNIGFTIESRKDHELPEILLGGVRVMEFDLNKVSTAPGSESEEAYQDGLVAGDSWS